MLLRTGDWKANIDGHVVTLRIRIIHPAGDVEGELVSYDGGGDVAFTGIWDEIAQRLTFLTGPLQIAGGNEYSREYYEGYLGRTPRTPAAGQDFDWFLAGFVQSGKASANMHGADRRSRFPWYAQISEIS